MKNVISRMVSETLSFLKGLRLEQFVAVILVGFLFLTTNFNSGQNDQSLGERMRERIQQTDRNSERPKTTGEFLDEARGDIPLDERFHNITRDSAEALKQFGQEYSVGAQESARNLRGNAAQAGQKLQNSVR